MNSFIRMELKGEHGMTLVEVLASVVLLTIILTIFLNVFVQSASMNQTSGDIIDATYIAQTEMEKMYSISKTTGDAEELGYHLWKEDEETGWVFYKKDIVTDAHYDIVLRLKNNQANTRKIIIEVYQRSDDNPQAKMQNVLSWGEE